MTIEILTFCLGVEASDEQLSIENAVNLIAFESFPGQVDLYYAFRVRFDLDEAGPHTYEVTFGTLDGSYPGPTMKEAVEIQPAPGAPFAWLTASSRLPNSKFNRPGDFKLDLKIDDKPLGMAVLTVQKA